MQSPWAALAAAVIVVGGLAGTAPQAVAQQGANQQQKWVKPNKAERPRAERPQRAQGQRAQRPQRDARPNRNARPSRNANVARPARPANARPGGPANARPARPANDRVVVNARRGGPPAWRYGHRYRGPYYGGRRWYAGGYWGDRYWGPGYYDYGWGGFAAGAAVGVVAGAAIAGAAAPTVVYDEPTYYVGPSGRVMARESDIVAVPPAGGYAPFTPGWYEYCSAKYRSFNRNTGMYTGYDGYQHYCQ